MSATFAVEAAYVQPQFRGDPDPVVGSLGVPVRPEKGAGSLLATAQSCAVIGLDGLIVQVEVDLSPGLPAFKNEGTQLRQVSDRRSALRVAARSYHRLLL